MLVQQHTMKMVTALTLVICNWKVRLDNCLILPYLLIYLFKQVLLLLTFFIWHLLLTFFMIVSLHIHTWRNVMSHSPLDWDIYQVYLLISWSRHGMCVANYVSHFPNGETIEIDKMISGLLLWCDVLYSLAEKILGQLQGYTGPKYLISRQVKKSKPFT